MPREEVEEDIDYSITHILGSYVSSNARGIQRCAVCGEKLYDSEGTTEFEIQPGFPGWLLTILKHGEDPPRIVYTPYYGPGMPMPENFCISLVEK